MAEVLVVEDNEDLLMLTDLLLTGAGHTVRSGRDGEEGLALISDRQPEVVVMDVEMPGLGGPGMASRMFVENLGRENIPIVIVSAHSDLAAIALAVGTPYFLSKPFAVKDLLALLDRALRERQVPRPPM